MSFARLGNYINRRLDELFPRPWLTAWETAQAQGWRPDAAEAYCQRCGCTIDVTAQTDRGCAFCVRKVLPWSSITRLATYHGPMESWIHQMKFQRQWKWAPLLGEALARQIPATDRPESTFLCPVPMHYWRRVKRGYNPAQMIAEAIGKHHGLKVLPVLKKVRATAAQSTLSPTQRQINVRQAFELPEVDLTGLSLWLVDDVKTSGATLRQCARLLRQAGAERVEVAVLAVADPKHAQFTML